MGANTQGEMPGWVCEWLSQPRLAPYISVAGPSGALDRYAWNCRVSAAVFELIGWFEVAWRNNIDRAICARRSESERHWLLDRSFPLRPRTWKKVEEAERAVRRGGHRVIPGRLIAELSLGFWRFTSSGYRQTLWRRYLSHAFPHAPSRPQPARLDRQLEAIILLRNRIAHHEPVGRVDDLRGRIEDMLTIGSWISPEMARWWRRNTMALKALTLPRGVSNRTAGNSSSVR